MDVPVVIPLTLLALAVCAGGALFRPRLDMALLLGLLAAIWTRVSGPVEGRILLTFSADHGFTEADYVSVIALALAALTVGRLLWAATRRPAERTVIAPRSVQERPVGPAR